MALILKQRHSVLRLIVYCVLISIATWAKANTQAQWLDGDIIFHTSQSNQSLAIQKATHSKYSHMGIIFLKDGKPYVYEASKTVRYTPIDVWIARGVNKHYIVKRLNNREQLLDDSTIKKLIAQANKLQGKPYDLTFEWSDQRIYCSELVWKIYDRGLNLQLGKLQKIKEFDLTNPIVKAKLYERYGNNIPLDEPVISPQVIFDSPLLNTVIQVE